MVIYTHQEIIPIKYDYKKGGQDNEGYLFSKGNYPFHGPNVPMSMLLM